MLDRDDRRTLAKWVLIAAAAYVGVAHLVYGFRHPELTDVQRLMNTVDTLLFR